MRMALAVMTVCAMLASTLLAAPPTGVETAHEQILQGVKEIASPGTPGSIVAAGPSTVVLVAGATDGKGLRAPVAVAGLMGRGRLIALGHNGYFGAEALKAADTGAFMANALRWAAGAKAGEGEKDKDKAVSVRVGVIGLDGFAAAMKEKGLDARDLPGAWEASLTDVDVVVANAGGQSDAQLKALRTFAERGGGVVMGSPGWGWLQLNKGKEIRQHPGTVLMGSAGIAWTDDTLSKTGRVGFVCGEVSPDLRADTALARLTEFEKQPPTEDKDTKAATAQASATVLLAVRSLPKEDRNVVAPCRALLAKKSTALTPTEASPLTLKQPIERLLVALQVEDERDARPAQVKAHPGAAAFPGSVPASAPRVTRTVEIDSATPGWHSTGLYAPPGQVLRVRVPEDAAKAGLVVRIGCHKDLLWHHDSWKRVPDISRTFDLAKPLTEAVNAFGGLVYIECPGGRAKGKAGIVRVEVAGAVESPRFVLGKTTQAEWKKSRAAPGPWAELESGKVIVSVPSESVRTLDEPAALMEFWDRISDAHATLAAIPLERERAERYVADVQISAGYMHSGYPIMTHLDAVADMTTLSKLREGPWGLLHELGHNHQVGDWTFGGTTEVTCNLFALHAIDTVCKPAGATRGHAAVDKPPSVAKYVAQGAKFDTWQKDPFLALQMYIQLEKQFGWEVFKKVFAEYRDLPTNQRPGNDAQKRDQWMVRFSRACGKNLGPFFVAWGVPVSDAARDSIKDLPAWMPEGWPGE